MKPFKKHSKLIHKTSIILFIVLLYYALTLGVVSATFVEMQKEHTPSKPAFQPGDSVQFEISVTVRTVNSGPILSIKNLKIVETLPPGLTYTVGSRVSVPTAISFINYGNGTLLWDFGPGPFTGEPQATITFDATIDADAPENQYIVNQAKAIYEETSSGVLSSPSVTDVIYIAYPILDIEKTGTELIHEGEDILYQITLKNTGHYDAENIVVTDLLPPGVIYTPGSATTTSGILDETGLPGNLGWSGTIAELSEIQITIPVTDDSNIISNLIENSVSYSEWTGNEVFIKKTDTCETIVVHPSIELIKTVETSKEEEPADITYSYKTTNTGDTILYGVTVFDETLNMQILGPVELAPGEFAEGETMLLNQNHGIYYNLARTNGVDPYDYPVEDYDDAEVAIREEKIIPEFVGGEVVQAVSDSQRILIVALTVFLAVIVVNLTKR